MKKLLYVTIFSVLIIFNFSCSESLLDLNPESQKVGSNFYRNQEELEQGVVAGYASLQSYGQYEIVNLVLGEIPSDNTYSEVPANDGGNFGQADLFSMTSGNTLIRDSWKHNYQGIQQCNIVLNRIEGISMSDNTKNRMKGEVYFLRALMYFNLVRIFGDVPLVTKETTNPNTFFGQPRTPKAEVYKQIETDLQQAIEILPEKASQKGRATKGAAYGLLGKVYITQNNYENALTNLLKVEPLGYKLLQDVSAIFNVNNKNNEEIVFAVQFQSGLNGNSEGSKAFQIFNPSGNVSGAKGHNLPTRDVYNLFSENDKRKKEYFAISKANVLYTGKLRQTSSVVQDGGSNVVVLRMADIFLLIAECYAHSNQIAEANLYLNKVIERAGLDKVNITDRAKLLETIALERRKELVGEGHRWFDLVRTGEAISVMNAYFKRTPGLSEIQINENNMIQPIPLGQINTDPAIIQNPGYN